MSRSLRSLAVAAGLLAGCSSLKVNTQYDPTAPFGAYRTYAWLATTPGAEQAASIRDPGVRALVVDAIDREMKRRGFVRTTPDQAPDFLVSVIGWAQNKVEVTNYGYGYAPAYMYGPFGPAPYSAAVPMAEVNQYTEGTLILDFVDARTNKLFWRGTATDTVTSPSHLKAVIDEAAKKLLEAYPPKPKQ
jgi:hypothetical protein